MRVETERRPWGSFSTLTRNANGPATVKVLEVAQGEALSLQWHEHRDERWLVVAGMPLMTVGELTWRASPGEVVEVPRREVHRIAADVARVVIVEVATGEFDEDDIVRVEDRYGR